MSQETDVAESEHEKPRGTFVLLLGFLVVIAVLWSYTFFLLLDRG